MYGYWFCFLGAREDSAVGSTALLSVTSVLQFVVGSFTDGTLRGASTRIESVISGRLACLSPVVHDIYEPVLVTNRRKAVQNNKEFKINKTKMPPLFHHLDKPEQSSRYGSLFEGVGR